MKDNAIRTAVCPLCGKTYHGAPALSRTDNETLICPDCGTRQALESLGVSKEEQDKILETIHRATGKPRQTAQYSAPMFVYYMSR